MRVQGNAQDRSVLVDGRVLQPGPSQRVFNHSPDGFSWGYAGSGPAQLALALLIHAGLDRATAVRLHQPLKRAFVAALPQHESFDVEFALDAWVTAMTSGDNHHDDR